MTRTFLQTPALSTSLTHRTAPRMLSAGLRPTALAVHLACAAMTGILAFAPVAQAQTAGTPATVNADVPAGPLADALNRFASQAGVAITVDAESLKGKTTSGLKAAVTPEEGFRQLLQGSGYQVQRTPAGYALVAAAAAPAEPATPDGEATLPAVTVRAGPAANSYAAEAASIARGADSLKEVPQSITVVTSKLIEDQNLTMMSDALAKAPGIVATTDGLGNPEFRSRGFVVDNYQVDNLGTSYTSSLAAATGMAHLAMPR